MREFSDLDFDKIEQFASAELERLQTQLRPAIIVPLGKNKFKIADWTIDAEDVDLVTCCKRLSDPISFSSKSCAILFVIYQLWRQIPQSQQIQTLDHTLLRLKSDAKILSKQSRRYLKIKNYEKFDLLHSKYLEVQAQFNSTNQKIKQHHSDINIKLQQKQRQPVTRILQ
jgi:hypothetical protein